MFYFLSKTLDALLSPLTWCFLALALSLRLRASRLPIALAIVLLGLFSNETVAELLWRALERGAVTTKQPGVHYDAIVVLGGLADRGRDTEYGYSYNENVERILAAYELLRRDEATSALLSSGPLEPPGRAASEADLLADQLAQWGIDRARLVIEGHSRNTRENAVESAEIIRARGWKRVLLVTSAFHMPRALGCFHAVGLAPDALSVDFRTPDRTPIEVSLVPRADALGRSTGALREFAGRLIYKARGYATE